jgi:hypothetical protein
MAVSHVYSNTNADATGTVTIWYGATTSALSATNLVRPSDWNSAHNQYVTISGNTSGSSTMSGTNIVFGGTNGITLSASSAAGAATMWIVGAPALSTYAPFNAIGMSTATVAAGNATSGPVSLYYFPVAAPVSAGIMNMMFSASFTTNGTSSGRQTMGIGMAIYTRGTGANSTTIGSFASASFSIGVTGNNSTYTFNQPTSTAYTGYGTGSTTSAGVSITSGYTGAKMFGFPINTLMTPGDYWIGLIATNSTSSVNVGLTLSYVGAIMNNQQTALAPIGSFSSAYSLGHDPAGGRWYVGNGSWTSAGSVTMVPVSIAFTSVSAGGATVMPMINFWRT